MDSRMWTFEWMSMTDRISYSSNEMLEKLNFPHFEKDERESRMHFWQVSNTQLHC